MAYTMPDGTPAPTVLRCHEAAAFMRIETDARRTLEKYRRRGLKAVRIGREYVYMTDSVVEFLMERETCAE